MDFWDDIVAHEGNSDFSVIILGKLNGHKSTRRAVAQNPFPSPKIIFDHSRVRFTANSKLALWARTMNLQPFRFTKNGCQKFFNVRSRDMGNSPSLFEPKRVICLEWPEKYS
jgi:hypothetical protein